jgi:hypothetical protein
LTQEDKQECAATLEAFGEEIAFSIGEVQELSENPNHPALLMWRRKLLVNLIGLFQNLDSSVDLTRLIELEQRAFQVLLDEQIDWERSRRVFEEQSLVERPIDSTEQVQAEAEARRARLYDGRPNGTHWYRGVAGPRGAAKPTSVTIHNTAGASSSEHYRNWLLSGETLCAAHEYWDKYGAFYAESLGNRSWHCGNGDGNLNSIGLEVCHDFGENPRAFLGAEQKVFIRAAEILKCLVFLQMRIQLNFIVNGLQLSVHGERFKCMVVEIIGMLLLSKERKTGLFVKSIN